MNSNPFYKYFFALVATVLMLASATPVFALSLISVETPTEEQTQAEELEERTQELSDKAEEFFNNYDETSNEVEANSENIEKFFVGFTLFTVVIFGFFALLGLGLFIFNIAMIIDCAQRDFEDKTVWLIVLIVGLLLGWGGLAAVVYYFVAKRSGNVNVAQTVAPIATPAPTPEANK